MAASFVGGYLEYVSVRDILVRETRSYFMSRISWVHGLPDTPQVWLSAGRTVFVRAVPNSTTRLLFIPDGRVLSVSRRVLRERFNIVRAGPRVQTQGHALYVAWRNNNPGLQQPKV